MGSCNLQAQNEGGCLLRKAIKGIFKMCSAYSGTVQFCRQLLYLGDHIYSMQVRTLSYELFDAQPLTCYWVVIVSKIQHASVPLTGLPPVQCKCGHFWPSTCLTVSRLVYIIHAVT